MRISPAPRFPWPSELPTRCIGTTPDGKLMIPVKSLEGVEIMSANLLLENETDPIIWSGTGDCRSCKAVLVGNSVAGY